LAISSTRKRHISCSNSSTTQINNDHTRKSYLNATRRFAEWCELHRLQRLADVQPFHVAAFVKDLQGHFSPPTVKQHLAAIRMLFDWLVTGHVIDVNPAHAVRGPKYVVKKGKTPVLNADEARALLDSIDISTLTGLRDRALIGVMVYTFARVNAVISMKVKDYFTQGRRGWVRLHEKGGKEHEVPCHHTLEKYLDEYVAAAERLIETPKGSRNEVRDRCLLLLMFRHGLRVSEACRMKPNGPWQKFFRHDQLPQQHESSSHNSGWQDGPEKQFYR
jgi:site-specific recombinase XerD